MIYRNDKLLNTTRFKPRVLKYQHGINSLESKTVLAICLGKTRKKNKIQKLRKTWVLPHHQQLDAPNPKSLIKTLDNDQKMSFSR